MSQYLHFFLVPKETKKPLFFYCINRNCDIYQHFNDTLSIPYSGLEDNYSELTVQDVESVIKSIQEEIDRQRTRMESTEEAYGKLKGLSSEQIFEFVNDYTSDKKYLEELLTTKHEAENILCWVSGVYRDGSDFEKVLIYIA